jgi:hypothetical protein
LYKFSRPSALYSTTASAAEAGTVTTLAKAATVSAGNTRFAKRDAGKRFFVMVLVSPGRRIQPDGVRLDARFLARFSKRRLDSFTSDASDDSLVQRSESRSTGNPDEGSQNFMTAT